MGKTEFSAAIIPIYMILQKWLEYADLLLKNHSAILITVLKIIFNIDNNKKKKSLAWAADKTTSEESCHSGDWSDGEKSALVGISVHPYLHTHCKQLPQRQ